MFVINLFFDRYCKFSIDCMSQHGLNLMRKKQFAYLKKMKRVYQILIKQGGADESEDI